MKKESLYPVVLAAAFTLYLCLQVVETATLQQQTTTQLTTEDTAA